MKLLRSCYKYDQRRHAYHRPGSHFGSFAASGVRVFDVRFGLFSPGITAEAYLIKSEDNEARIHYVDFTNGCAPCGHHSSIKSDLIELLFESGFGKAYCWPLFTDDSNLTTG